MRSWFRALVDIFPALLSYLLSQLIIFVKKILGIALIFGMIGIISYGFAFLLPDLLSDLTPISDDVCLLIEKILLSIAPALPTFFYALWCMEDANKKSNPRSIDLCFVAWILTLAITWNWI